VKYLIEWEIEPRYRKEAVKAIENFKQPKELRTVFAAHNCVASNRGIAVVDVDDPEVIQKAMSPMLNYTDFKVTPVTPVFPEPEK
jgi:hypothetical protein